MARVAFVDDYPAAELGHHPDLALGLAEAAVRMPGHEGHTRVYCPQAFLAGRGLSEQIEHIGFVRATGANATLGREQMSAVHRNATAAKVEVLINLFFDENHQSFPVGTEGPRLVQTLHRPAELADAVVGTAQDPDSLMRRYLARSAPDDLFVVHTRAGYEAARSWVTDDRLLELPWPAASLAEVDERFAAAGPATDQEPHALLIGDARDAKGVHELLTSLRGDGPLLRIVGQQPEGVRAALQERHPNTRVEWEPGWISPARLGEAIAAASVVVFPYLPAFGRHGGVSGALAQALTFGKPLVVSTVLADQLPSSHAGLIVEPGDLTGLRQAVEDAVRRSVELHRLTAAAIEQVRNDHTYDRHLERILARGTV